MLLCNLIFQAKKPKSTEQSTGSDEVTVVPSPIDCGRDIPRSKSDETFPTKAPETGQDYVTTVRIVNSTVSLRAPEVLSVASTEAKETKTGTGTSSEVAEVLSVASTEAKETKTGTGTSSEVAEVLSVASTEAKETKTGTGTSSEVAEVLSVASTEAKETKTGTSTSSEVAEVLSVASTEAKETKTGTGTSIRGHQKCKLKSPYLFVFTVKSICYDVFMCLITYYALDVLCIMYYELCIMY